jgi:hypothetical protein
MPTRKRRLFEAIEAGRFSEVIAILDDEPGLIDALGSENARVRDKTPLMYALQCRALRLARELIQRGANVRARMPTGPRSSVLQLAVKFAGPREEDHARMLSLVGELIDRGADPTDAIWSACSAYAPRFSWRARMIALLLSRGGDPDRLVGNSGNTTRELVRINAARFSAEVLRLFES